MDPKALKKDRILNKTALDLFVFSALGYAAGFCVCIFFKHKSAVNWFTAGMGSSIALGINKEHYHALP